MPIEDVIAAMQHAPHATAHQVHHVYHAPALPYISMRWTTLVYQLVLPHITSLLQIMNAERHVLPLTMAAITLEAASLAVNLPMNTLTPQIEYVEHVMWNA